MRNTLHVHWDHAYYLCRKFAIYLNDTAVPECTNITALNCTIGSLNDGVQYLVKVVATELDTEPIETPQIIAMLDANTGI